jgi:hypothetical protein
MVAIVHSDQFCFTRNIEYCFTIKCRYDPTFAIYCINFKATASPVVSRK